MDVVNLTSTLALHSQCGIMETNFDYPIPTGYNSACHLLQFRVTPVSDGGDGITALVELLQVPEGNVVNTEFVYIIIHYNYYSP